MATKRRKKHEDHEEHPDERWLVTYADMITLLMVLFIVLYAISQVDLAKFEKFKAGVAKDSKGIDSKAGVLDGGEGLLDDNGNPKPEVVKQAIADINARAGQAQAVAAEKAAFQAVSDDLNAKLSAAGLDATIGTRIESRGLVITILTDQVLFTPGSDQLTPEGAAIVDKLAGVLGQMDNAVSIEGHTDDQPIATARFQSNWELSTARATTVLRSLVDPHGIDPHRLSAAGYADTRPVASNATPEGRAANRRVEIVIHTKLTDPITGAPAADSQSASDTPTTTTPDGAK
jgi:chemotaxis protein MotB